LGESRVEFRILGGLEVREGGRPVPIGAGKQRALLAILLLHANEVLATDRLIDELWGESPPDTARKAVQVYVTRLRKTLGAERIRTHEPGYVLELDSDELDLARFERGLDEGRRLREEGEDARAAGLLREALALWNGPPLADFTYEPFAQTEIPRLEELRLAALEERIDADLALGHGGDLVAELEALVAQHPYRERLRGQLMLALYRDGRQAEALTVYQETRKLLVEELGIEPNPSLQRLEGDILRQEPALETEPAEPGPSVAPDAREEKPRGRRWLLAAAGAVLALGAVAVGVFLIRPSDRDFLPALDENTVGVIDAEAAGIERQIRLPGRPSALDAGGGFVWVVSERDGTVSRIDPATQVGQVLQVGESANGVAYGAGSVWVTNGAERTVAQVNPESVTLVQTFEVGNGPADVAVGGGAVWVANTIDGTVSRIDVESGAVTTIPVGGNPSGIAADQDTVWVTSESTGVVVTLHADSGTAAQTIGVGNGPTAVAIGEGSIWVANSQDGTVSRIDPATSSVSDTIGDVGTSPAAVAAGGGAVWVASARDGTIARLDPETGRVDEVIPVESSPSALALEGEKLWTATLPSLESHRGGVLRVESFPLGCRCVDPAVIRDYPEGQLVLPLVHDGLVAYRRVNGIGGGALVANLAQRLPTPTDEGRTYTFQLRRGIRFSDGTPVRASDVRYSLERLLTIEPGQASTYAIAGSTECADAEAEVCDLSQGIEVDDATGTITIRLNEADPEFLHKLSFPSAFVVPTGTPPRQVTGGSIPTTGPYRIASLDPKRELRLVRNPHFRVWSPDARPDGYPDEIRFRFSRNPEAQLAAVERGEADWMFDPPIERLQGLLTRYPGRLHSDAPPWTDYLFLNTRVPPFDDLAVRQALNYAVDRGRMVRLLGGTLKARVTCQILPPAVPGYSPYCPYTNGPNQAGTWSAPDLGRARSLIATSGTRGARIEVLAYERFGRGDYGRYVVDLLRRLGYRSSLRVIPDSEEYFAYVMDSRNEVQIGPFGWYADAASASFLRDLFSCASFAPRSAGNLNLSAFCDREIEATMQEAGDLQASDPVRANELWTEVDRALADRAAAAPLVNQRVVTFVSARVGNYQFHPLWTTLFDQLWVE
jgi:peptide/nickel transport system substrate-binding protein